MIYIIIAIFLLLFLIFYALIQNSPIGYEDKNGFHYGKRK